MIEVPTNSHSAIELWLRPSTIKMCRTRGTKRIKKRWHHSGSCSYSLPFRRWGIERTYHEGSTLIYLSETTSEWLTKFGVVEVCIPYPNSTNLLAGPSLLCTGGGNQSQQDLETSFIPNLYEGSATWGWNLLPVLRPKHKEVCRVWAWEQLSHSKLIDFEPWDSAKLYYGHI